MRLALMVVAFTLFAAPQAIAQAVDPFQRARDGFVECFSPDTVAKTCRGMSTYRFLEGDQVASDGIVLIQASPAVAVHATTSVYMRDGLVCDRVDPEDFEAMHFTIDGAAAPEHVTRQLRATMRQAMAGVEELCARFTPHGDGAALTVYADGVERPDLAERVIWVRPEDGYTIGLANASDT